VLTQLIEAFNSHASSMEESLAAIRESIRDVERRIKTTSSEAARERATHSLVVLTHPNWRSCRRALEWLDAHDLAYAVRPIDKEPPTAGDLERWVAMSGVPLRKVLNTNARS
jgi:hypothetical protein